MANKKIKVKLIRENAKVPESHNGNWFDIYTSGVSILRPQDYKRAFEIPKEPQVINGKVIFNHGDIVILHLGIATDLGKGYEANLIKRSSLFRKKGLILTNAIGLIDDCYNGDTDEWLAVMYATRYGTLEVGDRHMQFTIKKTQQFDMEEVETLGNPSRGGYGSTDK